MKHLKLLFLCFSLGLFASCSESSDDLADIKNVTFSGSIGKFQTRVTGNAWDERDAIGVFAIVPESNPAAVYDEKSNVKYTTTGDGKFTQAGIGIEFPEESKLDFLAYYPYSIAVTDFKYPIAEDTDPLFSNNAKGYDKSSSNVNLAFNHMTSKVVINVEVGQGVTSLEGLAAKLNNIVVDGSFNLADGSITLGNAKTVTPSILISEDMTTATITKLVMPKQSFQDVEVEIDLGENKFENWNSQADIHLESSKEYIFKVKLSLEADELFAVEIGTAIINDWETSYEANEAVVLHPDPNKKNWTVETIVGQKGVHEMTDGIGTDATCKLPTSLSFAPDGSIWFTDRGNFAIRRISKDLEVTTIAGEPNTDLFSHPWQGAFNSKGDYYVASKGNHKIQKVDGNTHEVTTFADNFKNPMSLIFDKDDNMYVADRDNEAIQKITPEGERTTFSLGMKPNALVFTPQGTIIIGGANYTLIELSLDTKEVVTIAGNGVKDSTFDDGEKGNPLTANIGFIFGLGSDDNGVIYIADALYNVIRTFTPASNGNYLNGTIKTIAGSGSAGSKDGNAYTAEFHGPYAILPTSDGKTIYVADAITYIIRKLSYN